MPDLGLEVLFKGKNMIRILGGLWVALRISLLAVLISIPLGIVLGILMTSRNKIIKVILRIYLEVIRIMPVSYTHLPIPCIRSSCGTAAGRSTRNLCRRSLLR